MTERDAPMPWRDTPRPTPVSYRPTGQPMSGPTGLAESRFGRVFAVMQNETIACSERAELWSPSIVELDGTGLRKGYSPTLQRTVRLVSPARIVTRHELFAVFVSAHEPPLATMLTV